MQTSTTRSAIASNWSRPDVGHAIPAVWHASAPVRAARAGEPGVGPAADVGDECYTFQPGATGVSVWKGAE